MKIQGKWVLITGASSGIGAALARAAAGAGGRPLLLARREAELRQVADSLGPGAEARVYPVDLSDPKAVDDVAERITSEVGTPDVLVNNAGAGRWKFVDETSPEEAVQMMAEATCSGVSSGTKFPILGTRSRLPGLWSQYGDFTTPHSNSVTPTPVLFRSARRASVKPRTAHRAAV